MADEKSSLKWWNCKLHMNRLAKKTIVTGGFDSLSGSLPGVLVGLAFLIANLARLEHL